MTLAERPTTVAHLAAGPVEYRLERRADATVVVLHGAHMRAGLALGEEVYAEAGLTVLAPSRPGYGRTPISTGTSVPGFADVTAALCRHLGISKVAAVVGISAGGPTAVALAARHRDLVERLILQSAVGPLPWPARRTRLAARFMFSPGTERMTWGAMRALLRRSPDRCLRLLLSDLSTLPAQRVVADLRPEHRTLLVTLLTQMRSGAGFRNDLRPTDDATAGVDQPALVIATRRDGTVPFTHAQSLAATIQRAELVESQADSHFVEFGTDWPAIAEAIRTFLATDAGDIINGTVRTTV